MADSDKLNNNALATLDEVKRFMGTTGANDDVDKEIISSINRISKAMETYCDREFYIQEHTETHRGDGSESLIPDHYPITVVSGIWSSTSRTWDSDTLIDSDDYFTERGGNSIVWYNNQFPKSSYENIRVIYTAGLHSGADDTSDDAITPPLDLKLACVKEAGRNITFKDDKGLNSRSTDEAGAGGIDTMNFIISEFMPETEAVLNRYLRRRLY